MDTRAGARQTARSRAQAPRHDLAARRHYGCHVVAPTRRPDLGVVSSQRGYSTPAATGRSRSSSGRSTRASGERERETRRRRRAVGRIENWAWSRGGACGRCAFASFLVRAASGWSRRARDRDRVRGASRVGRGASPAAELQANRARRELKRSIGMRSRAPRSPSCAKSTADLMAARGRDPRTRSATSRLRRRRGRPPPCGSGRRRARALDPRGRLERGESCGSEHVARSFRGRSSETEVAGLRRRHRGRGKRLSHGRACLHARLARPAAGGFILREPCPQTRLRRSGLRSRQPEGARFAVACAGREIKSVRRDRTRRRHAL